MPERYEVPVNPSFYDIIRNGKIPVYHFESPENPKPETLGANPKNIGNYLRNIEAGDSLVFYVNEKRKEELGHKGAEYDNELERIVDRRERKGNTIYLYFKTTKN